MKFKLARQSDWLEDKKEKMPCFKKYKPTWEQYIRTEERIANDPKKISKSNDYPNEDWWYKKGTNHRVEHGHIMRDFQKEGWFVEFETLNDLMAFQKSHGDILLRSFDENYSITELVIVDDYMC